MPRVGIHNIKPVKNPRKGVGMAIFIMVLFFFQVACSPKTGSSLLRFLFDGVPETKAKDTSALTSQVALVSDSIRKAIISDIPVSTPGLHIHPPYQERACDKCHLSGDAPSAVTYSQDRFCYGCHKSFTEKFEVIHGPVAGGFCTNCHAPHHSKNAKLLLRLGQAICTPCHTLATVMKNETHADIGNTSCTECHNPHGGDDRYFSR